MAGAPAFAQEPAAPQGFQWMDMIQHMSYAGMAVAVVLFVMSFWSIGVAIERIYTFNQARKQSKLYAPQVAKHLKDGRLKEAIALSAAKDYRYSHLAKVVMAGLQEYQFQQDSGGTLNREDVLDTVRGRFSAPRRSPARGLKKGIAPSPPSGPPVRGDLGTVVGVIVAFTGIAATGGGGIAGVSAECQHSSRPH
jgi:biopolymer transport protein ExbB/biopolymer transport protein TolQ